MAGSSSTHTTTRSSVSTPTSDPGPPPPSTESRVASSKSCRRFGFQLKRQPEDELGALSLLAVDLDATAVGPDDLVGHVEPEARALAHGLRGEERQEEFGAVLLGDARPRVPEGNPHAFGIGPRLQVEVALPAA